MTQNDGKLTDLQKQFVVEWVNSKTALIGKCSLCGHRDWTVLSHVIVAPVWGVDNMIARVAGRGFLNAGLICANCGNTHLLNASHMGLVKDGELLETPELFTSKDAIPEEADD